MFDAENGKGVFDRLYDSLMESDLFLFNVRNGYRADEWWDDISYHMSRLRIDRNGYSDLMAYVYTETEDMREHYDSYGYCLFADGFWHVLCCMMYDRYWCKFYSETID